MFKCLTSERAERARLLASALAVMTATPFTSAAYADAAFAWGSGAYGSAGDGTNDLVNATPSFVPTLGNDVINVASGALHQLAVTSDGNLYTWGLNNFGQIGNGALDAADANLAPYFYPANAVPTPVAGISNVQDIAGGQYHSYALSGGAVYAFGFNSLGQAGLGSTSPSALTAPTMIPTLSSGVTAIASGSNHGLALKDGSLYAWGSGNAGQLGDGIANTSPQHVVTTPFIVPGMETGVTQFDGGTAHTLAVKDGALYAWGNNGNGALGAFTSEALAPSPVAVPTLSEGVTAISAGRDYSLAVKDGQVYAWGTDIYSPSGSPDVYEGLLGLGPGDDTTDVPTLVPGITGTIVDVFATNFTSFALDADGSLWAWGINANGEAGTGDDSTYVFNTPQHIVLPDGMAFTFFDPSSASQNYVIGVAGFVVPEPSSLILLTVGAGFVSFRRRRA